MTDLLIIVFMCNMQRSTDGSVHLLISPTLQTEISQQINDG